jgi:hypothetical protein
MHSLSASREPRRKARRLSDANSEDAAIPGSQTQKDVHRTYEPPQIIVIGSIRETTTGSASSGRTDANSQYYW